MDEYIEREAVAMRVLGLTIVDPMVAQYADAVLMQIQQTPAADVLPVTRAELKHLMNDTIAYIWKLEDRGATDPMYGYDSRKALLEKLKKFYAEHFPEMGECGGRMDGE